MNNGFIYCAENLCKSYPLGKTKVPVLKELSLSVPTGSFSVLSGVSGSGKTTLLNLLSLIDSPDSGAVYFEGCTVDYSRKRELTRFRRDSLGIIFQEFNLVPNFTVYENIEYVFLETPVPLQERKKRVLDILDEVGIGELKGRFPHELSGGQRQRVSIARGLVRSPRLILADEPTAHLDSENRRQIFTLMEELHRRRDTTFLVATHDEETVRRADIHWVLEDGRLREGVYAETL